MIKNNILLIWWFIWYLKVGVNEFCRGAKYRSIVQHKQNSYPNFPPPSAAPAGLGIWLNGTIIRKNICFTSAVRLIPLQHSCSSFFTKVLFVPFTTLSGDLKIFAVSFRNGWSSKIGWFVHLRRRRWTSSRYL